MQARFLALLMAGLFISLTTQVAYAQEDWRGSSNTPITDERYELFYYGRYLQYDIPEDQSLSSYSSTTDNGGGQGLTLAEVSRTGIPFGDREQIAGYLEKYDIVQGGPNEGFVHKNGEPLNYEENFIMGKMTMMHEVLGNTAYGRDAMARAQAAGELLTTQNLEKFSYGDFNETGLIDRESSIAMITNMEQATPYEYKKWVATQISNIDQDAIHSYQANSSHGARIIPSGGWIITGM